MVTHGHRVTPLGSNIPHRLPVCIYGDRTVGAQVNHPCPRERRDGLLREQVERSPNAAGLRLNWGVCSTNVFLQRVRTSQGQANTGFDVGEERRVRKRESNRESAAGCQGSRLLL